MTAEMTVAETLIDDAELLARARAQDGDAFAALVERYKDLIVGYLARLTGSRSRAEDVAQETFMRFYQQLHRYRERGTLAAYLLRIATNLVRSEERRARRWRLLKPLFAVSDGAHRPAPSPQAEALAGEVQRQVTAAIAALDLRYRVPLVLREIEGLSYRQIADVVGVGEGTVKSRLHRARELLKARLEPFWNGGQVHATHGRRSMARPDPA
ncbi:MAG: sigma-70 family RNA polymerase sigma factor [Acidobacteria bacterium]|nr:MAG: sigma-70 family RNA polymerase sigma factor [Acidobacteriota bacterium]